MHNVHALITLFLLYQCVYVMDVLVRQPHKHTSIKHNAQQTSWYHVSHHLAPPQDVPITSYLFLFRTVKIIGNDSPLPPPPHWKLSGETWGTTSRANSEFAA